MKSPFSLINPFYLDNTNLVDDEMYDTLRTKGVEICEFPSAIQCWDTYMDTETDTETVFCNVRSGKLFK